MSLFAFVQNAPLGNIDPHGRSPLGIGIGLGLIGIGLGAAELFCWWHLTAIREEATEATASLMPIIDPAYDEVSDGPNIQGTPADAMRHCIGACMADQDRGSCGTSSRVRRLIQERELNPGLDFAQDFANNAVGFSITGSC